MDVPGSYRVKQATSHSTPDFQIEKADLVVRGTSSLVPRPHGRKKGGSDSRTVLLHLPLVN